MQGQGKSSSGPLFPASKNTLVQMFSTSQGMEDPDRKQNSSFLIFKHFELFLRLAWATFLFVTFMYWSINAIIKFSEQPVATEIKFKVGA